MINSSSEKFELEPYQHASAAWLIAQSRGVLGSEIGTGKSAMIIQAGNLLQGQIWIVAPPGLVLNWKREIALWAETVTYQVVKNRKDPIKKDVKWVLWSYDFYSHYTDLNWLPEAIAFDEGHWLKNLEAARTLACLGKKSLTRLIPHVWPTTGTPFPNNLIDCYPLFNFSLRGALGTYEEAGQRYCYIKPHPFRRFKMLVYGCNRKTLPEFVERVKPVLRRDEFATCGAALPEFKEIVIPIETKEARAFITANQEIQDKVAEALDAGEKVDFDVPALSTFMKELSMFRVFPIRDLAREFLDADEQVVIFVHHREFGLSLAQELKKLHPTEIIRGGVDKSLRDEHVANFQAGDIRCLVLSLKAASVGLTLTASKIAIFAEQFWTPESLDQAKGRLRRKGQTRMGLFYFPQFEDSIDESVHRSARSKRKNVELFWDHFHGRAVAEPEEVIDWGDVEWE